MNNKVTFNQITLITDGYSNEGISPIDAAKNARKIGIIVNVIGIIETNQTDEQGKREIESIAAAGGGLCKLVTLKNFSNTVQLITRNALTNTIQEVVHAQLLQILDESNLSSISPSKRICATNLIEEISEYSQLNVLLLIDQSASMIGKGNKIEEAINDFQVSLQSRSGDSNVSVVTFPGLHNIIDIKVPWTDKKEYLDNIASKLIPNGKTPTGSAILSSIKHFTDINSKPNKIIGVLDEYVV
ncbi:MAG: VWA domain-containing protein [Vulcanibacillus sp.]